MKIPDFDKIRVRLSQDNNNDYMSMSNDDLLYEYIKTYGNTLPLIKKEKRMKVDMVNFAESLFGYAKPNNDLLRSELQHECNDYAKKLMRMHKNIHIEFSVFTLDELENEVGETNENK